MIQQTFYYKYQIANILFYGTFGLIALMVILIVAIIGTIMYIQKNKATLVALAQEIEKSRMEILEHHGTYNEETE